MKKILFVASTLSHIENFHIPYLKYFKDNGYIVHIIGKSNNKSNIPYVDKTIDMPFEKNMFSIKNFIIAFKISKIIKLENYDIISIHTTLAAFFSRLGIMLSLKKPTLVINTVHGYLFDKSSSLIKRIIMILAEKLTKCVTDTIIVMNSQDYDIAKKYKLYKNSIYLVDGMGVNLSKFPKASVDEKMLLRKKYNFSVNDFILVYIAEFSKRKNQKFLIDSIKTLINDGYNDIKLVLLGDGKLFNELVAYSKEINVSDNVIFVGYSKDTCLYYKVSDVCVSSSRIEGLPFNIMEAMSVGLPIVASKIKGHEDLILPSKNGFLFEYDNSNEFCEYIKLLYSNKNLQKSMSINSIDLSKKYSIDVVSSKIINIILDEYESHF